MYKPDRVFMSDLRKLDPRLGCYYETAHGHFVITYERAHGEKVPILMVQGENGEFRQPDKRDLIKLFESDTHRVDAKARIKQAAEYMEKEREKTKKKAHDDIRDMTKDDKRILAPRIARLMGGKHNSTFRRINLKQRGQTVDELSKCVNN